MNTRKMLRLLAINATLLLLLSACSTGYDSAAYETPRARRLPAIPEVSRPVVVRPRQAAPRKSRVRPARKVVAKRKRPALAKVRPYSVKKSKPADAVITQTDINSVNAALKKEEALKQSATVDIDPYAEIRESGSASSSASPAVKALLISAQADLAIGNSNSAVSKLERGLRIESQNAKLWNLLAKAHYDQADYQQAINMAKKSIRYSSKDDEIAKNWALIKKAGLKSGDTTVVKEAINYTKINP